jgi:hypothetical protein
MHCAIHSTILRDIYPAYYVALLTLMKMLRVNTSWWLLCCAIMLPIRHIDCALASQGRFTAIAICDWTGPHHSWGDVEDYA